MECFGGGQRAKSGGQIVECLRQKAKGEEQRADCEMPAAEGLGRREKGRS